MKMRTAIIEVTTKHFPKSNFMNTFMFRTSNYIKLGRPSFARPCLSYQQCRKVAVGSFADFIECDHMVDCFVALLQSAVSACV